MLSSKYYSHLSDSKLLFVLNLNDPGIGLHKMVTPELASALAQTMRVLHVSPVFEAMNVLPADDALNMSAADDACPAVALPSPVSSTHNISRVHTTFLSPNSRPFQGLIIFFKAKQNWKNT